MAEVLSTEVTVGISSGVGFTFNADLPAGRLVGDTMIAVITSDEITLTDTNPNYDWEELLSFDNANQACLVLYRNSTMTAEDDLQVELNGAGDYRVLIVATVGRAYVAEALSNGTGSQGGGGYGAVTTSSIDVGLEADSEDLTLQVVSVDGSSTFPTSTDLGTPTGTYNDGGAHDAWAYWISGVSEYTVSLPARDGHVRAAVRIYSRALTYVPAGPQEQLLNTSQRGLDVDDDVPQYGAAQHTSHRSSLPYELPSDNPTTVRDILKAARVNMVTEADLPWTTTSAPLSYETEYNTGGLSDPDPYYDTVYNAVANRRPTIVTPRFMNGGYPTDGSRSWSPNVIPEEDWPEGAIGWEWPDGNNPGADRWATLVDVQVVPLVEFGNYDSTIDDELEYPTFLYAQTSGVTFGDIGLTYGLTGWDNLGGTVVDTWSAEGLRPAVSIIDYLNDDLEVLLWLMAPVVIETDWAGVTPGDPDSQSDLLIGNPAEFESGEPTEHVYWIYDTPPFVWLYEGVEVESPRRITGRGDALMGGARRIYPTPRSRQRSNRIAGDFV